MNATALAAQEMTGFTSHMFFSMDLSDQDLLSELRRGPSINLQYTAVSSKSRLFFKYNYKTWTAV